MKFVTLITCISTFNSLKEVFKVIPIRNFNQPIKSRLFEHKPMRGRGSSIKLKTNLGKFFFTKNLFLIFEAFDFTIWKFQFFTTRIIYLKDIWYFKSSTLKNQR